ncbi:hypothetical protein KUCAC02_012666 [Chaenocephalus aceratus]|uniref:Uncharacterized protein n=1 Tax=Chaenocephalus aceratus TaxID=36190 RepID=A0ACB9XCL2_CHAAC|nr:hypothetical protein KUCAC02_012666 [Chaenocephalus aceratus]
METNVKFDDCMGNEAVVFRSSDPIFSVRTDGSIYAQEEGASLDEPVQFKLTAGGPTTRVWETVIQLALIDPLLPQQNENEVIKEEGKVAERKERKEASQAPPPVIMFSGSGRNSSKGLRRQKRDWVIPPINVAENSRGPFPQMLVSIRSDQDKDISIRYSITGVGADQPPNEVFNIDPVLRAHAVDMNGNQVENPIDLYIFVIDMNDNRPQFQKPGSKPGTYVMHVSAFDGDDNTTANGMVRYRILSQTPHSTHPQHVHHQQVRLEISLPWQPASIERKCPSIPSSYKPRTWKGNLNFGLSNTATAIITVTDINDNPPMLTSRTSFPSAKIVTDGMGTGMQKTLKLEQRPCVHVIAVFREVPENRVDLVVANLTVIDADQPHSPNWNAIYRIISGDPNGHFTIRTDPVSNDGMVTVMTAFYNPFLSLPDVKFSRQPGSRELPSTPMGGYQEIINKRQDTPWEEIDCLDK